MAGSKGPFLADLEDRFPLGLSLLHLELERAADGLATEAMLLM